MNNIYFVYAYIRQKDSTTAPAGTPYYIGKGKNKRHLEPHNKVPVPKDRAYIIILESNLTEVGALALERRLIRWYGRKNIGTGILINLTDGGDGGSGYKHTEKFKSFISKINKGKKVKPESKLDLNGFIIRYGLELGFERWTHRRKSSDSSSLQAFIKRFGTAEGPIKFEEYKKISSQNRLGSKNPFFNKKHTLESRQKISSANTGKSKFRTQEHNAKIGLANKGKKQPTSYCIHCGKIASTTNIKRWHNDKCKNKNNINLLKT